MIRDIGPTPPFVKQLLGTGSRHNVLWRTGAYRAIAELVRAAGQAQETSRECDTPC